MDNLAKEELQEVKVKQSKGGQVFLVFLAILMTLVSLAAVFIAIPDNNWFIVLIGAFGVLFFGAGMLVFIKSLFSKSHLLIVNRAGFYDYSSALSTNDTLIPWHQVKAIEIIQVTSEVFVAVSLKDPQIAENARSKFGNMTARANKGLGYADVLITPKTAKGMTPEEIRALMYEYWTSEYGPGDDNNNDDGEESGLKDLDQL